MADGLVTSLSIKAAINKQFEVLMFSCCTETIQRSFVASNILVGRSLTFGRSGIKPICVPGIGLIRYPTFPQNAKVRLRPTSILEATKDLWIVSVQHENIRVINRTSNCLLIAALIDSDITKLFAHSSKPQLVRGANFK